MQRALLQVESPEPEFPVSESRGGADRLPLDLPTLWRAVWRRRGWLAAWIGVSLAAGVGAAIAFAPRVWTAEAVLLYQPPADQRLLGLHAPPSLETHRNLAKIVPHLAETRLRLKLPCSLSQLGAACDIVHPRDSQLLVFRTTWREPQNAAEIANTMSDVFMLRQQRLRRTELGALIRDLDVRTAALRKRLNGLAGAAGPQAAVRRELESFRNRINTADEMYEKSLTELKAVERQLADLAVMENDARRALLESHTLNGAGETMSSLNIRVERLRESIQDTRRSRITDISARQWEARIKFSQMLLSQGFLSRQAFDHELAELEKARAAARDDEQIEQLKEELEEIYRRMRPDHPDGIESAPLMQSLAVQRYAIRLSLSAAQERVLQLESSRGRLNEEYQALLREDPARGDTQQATLQERQQLDTLEETLAVVRGLADSNRSDFQPMTRAVRPSRPLRSYRKLVCAACCSGLISIGLSAVVLLQVFNPTLRSENDARLKLDLEFVFPLPQRDSAPASRALFAEGIRRLAARVRASEPTRGARLLVAGAAPREGRSLIARELAECFARRGERTVVLDCDLRSPAAEGDSPGLSEYLEGKMELASLLETAEATRPGAAQLPRGAAVVDPDRLASPAMDALLDALSERFQVVVLDAPPAEAGADLESLALFCHGAVLVVRASQTAAAAARRVCRRLQDSETPLLAAALNRTEGVFLDPLQRP